MVRGIRAVATVMTWGSTATVAAIVLAGGGPAATAMPADDAVVGYVVEAMADHGLLMPAEAEQNSAEHLTRLAPDGGLSVSADQGTVRVSPVTDRRGILAADGHAVVYPDSEYALALASPGAGGAGHVVIADESAPDEFRFALTVDGLPATLEQSGSRIIVSSAAGEPVNVFQAPVARDAVGVPVQTALSIDGSTIVQRVEHRGAQYPVTADARLACDGLWCTLELTRHETGLLADNALNSGILCGLLGPGAALCVVMVGGAWAMANIARNTGQCVGVRVWQKTMWTQMHLVYLPCYA